MSPSDLLKPTNGLFEPTTGICTVAASAPISMPSKVINSFDLLSDGSKKPAVPFVSYLSYTYYILFSRLNVQTVVIRNCKNIIHSWQTSPILFIVITAYIFLFNTNNAFFLLQFPLIHHPVYSLHQPKIRRQPLNAVKLILSKPPCLLSLQQNKVTADDFTPKAVHRQVKVGIIVLNSFY